MGVGDVRAELLVCGSLIALENRCCHRAAPLSLGRIEGDDVPAVGPEDPRYTLRTGQMDYDANYQLINDNLTDFTHLSYVHPNSFGTSDEFARRGQRNSTSPHKALRAPSCNSPISRDCKL